MSESHTQAEWEQPPSSDSKTGLWIALFVAVFCLLAAIVVASLSGLGWIAYTRLQDDSATSTAEAQRDNATATAEAHITLPPPGWVPQIDDQFASNEHGWNIGPNKRGENRVMYFLEDESYHMQLKSGSDDGTEWWAQPDGVYLLKGLRDFYVGVDCKLVDGDAAGTAYGLSFRIRDNGYYIFSVADDRLMSLSLNLNEEWSDLLPWERTDLIHPGEFNRVAILAEGTHYKFFINGQLAYELEDAQISQGSVAVRASVWGKNNADFQFDNFQIYEPE